MYIDHIIDSTQCCEVQADILEIDIVVRKNGETVSQGTALTFESAEELLGKLERVYG